MPTYFFPIEETEDTVIRPITTEIISMIIDDTSLDKDDVPIYLMGQYGKIPQAKSTVDEEDDRHRLSTDTRAEITVTEEFLGENTTAVLYDEHRPIFAEPKLNILVKPSYQQTRNTVTVQLHCRSRVEANRWKKSLQARISRGAFTKISAVKYYYPIPNEIVFILATLYDMREKVAGYGDDIGDWLREHFTDRLDSISNYKGTGHQFVIQETQGRIVGNYSFDYDIPEPEKKDDNTWVMEFSYTYTYDQPQTVSIHFPAVIHNQMIPESIRDVSITDDDYPVGHYLTESASAYEQLSFNGQTNPPRDFFSGESIPRWDDWYPKYHHPRYHHIFRIACQVSEQEPTWILNVGEDIYPHEWPSHVLAYLKDTPQSHLIPDESIFVFTLHRWKSLEEMTDLRLDENLKLTSITPMNLRDMFHLCIEINSDLSALTFPALERLCNHPKVLHSYLEIYLPDSKLNDLIEVIPLPSGWKPGDPLPPGYPEDWKPGDPSPLEPVNPNEVIDIIEDERDDRNWIKPTRPMMQRIVGLYSIVGRRMSDLKGDTNASL